MEYLEIWLIKLCQPRKHENNDMNIVTFTRSYNDNPQFSTNLKIALKSLQIDNFKKHFTTKKLLTT